MNSPSKIIDRPALARNRRRAKAGALFLQEAAREEIRERLEFVNRQFARPAVVTPFPDAWRPLAPDATFVPDDEVLDLEAGGHDLVIHGLSIHWAEDPVGQIVQCRRALRPDGLFLGISLGGRTLAELRAALTEAEAEITGGLSPRILPMAGLRDLGDILQRAGLALPVADSVPLSTRHDGTLELMRDLRASGEGNALAGRLRVPTRRGVFERAAEIHAQRFPDGTGGVRTTFDMICLTGWAPHPDQPKPARPGSAGARLADALDTTEQKLDG